MALHEGKLSQGEHETENHKTRQDIGLTLTALLFLNKSKMLKNSNLMRFILCFNKYNIDYIVNEKYI